MCVILHYYYLLIFASFLSYRKISAFRSTIVAKNARDYVTRRSAAPKNDKLGGNFASQALFLLTEIFAKSYSIKENIRLVNLRK